MSKKIIGLICAWGCEKFIEPTILQALRYCDDVIISIGVHNEKLLKFEDNTLNIIKKYSNRIKFIEVETGNMHLYWKTNIMQKMLEMSNYYEKDNWIWILDVDEFYFDSDVEKIKNTIKEDKYNSILLPSKCFYINTRNHFNTTDNRLRKILSNNSTFSDMQSFGDESNCYFLDTDKGIFHYSFLMNPYMKKIFWETEYSDGNPNENQLRKIKWIDEVYLKWDINNEDESLKKYGTPQGPHGAFRLNNGKMFTYDGKHPIFIEQFGLTKIKDFRKIYKNE